MRYILFKPKRTAAKFSDRTDYSPGWRPHLPTVPLSSRCPSAWPWGHRWDKHGMPGWSQGQGHVAPASLWAHCWWAVAPALTAVGQVCLKTNPQLQSSTAFQSRTQNHTESMKQSFLKQNPKSHWQHETIFSKAEPGITLRAWNNVLDRDSKTWLNGNSSRACHSEKEAMWFRNCPYI